jgi:hypothetical protein
MIYGISGAPIPMELPFSQEVTNAASVRQMPPCFIYAFAWRETIREYGAGSAGKMSDNNDGGHGLFQLTESYPDNWADPTMNALYAIDYFIKPALDYWHGLENFCGDTLVLLVAATFNEGLGKARQYHAQGDVDAGTTDEYGHGVLGYYKNMIAGRHP